MIFELFVEQRRQRILVVLKHLQHIFVPVPRIRGAAAEDVILLTVVVGLKIIF